MNLRKTRKGGKKKKKRIKKTGRGKHVTIFKTGSQTPQQALQSQIRDAKKQKEYAELFRKILKNKGRTNVVGENQNDITRGITTFKNGIGNFKPIPPTKKSKQKLNFVKIEEKLDLEKIIDEHKETDLDDLKIGDKFYAVENIVKEPVTDPMQSAQDYVAYDLYTDAKEALKYEEFDFHGVPRKILYCKLTAIDLSKSKIKYKLLNQFPEPNIKNLLITNNNLSNWDFYK